MVGFDSSDGVMYLCPIKEIVSGISFRMSKSSTDVIEGIARSMTNRKPLRCPCRAHRRERAFVFHPRVFVVREEFLSVEYSMDSIFLAHHEDEDFHRESIGRKPHPNRINSRIIVSVSLVENRIEYVYNVHRVGRKINETRVREFDRQDRFD